MKLPIVTEMVKSINAINGLIDPNWTKLGWDNETAIAVEAAEGLESHGWKWWKKQETDVANCQMELIDIWHFMLANLIQGYGNERAASVAISALNASPYLATLNPKQSWRRLMAGIDYAAFNTLRKRYQLNDATFATLFFAKAELNILRQLNGYKEGTYKKWWTYSGHEVEDNKVVAEIVKNYDLTNPAHVEQFRVELRSYYELQTTAT